MATLTFTTSWNAFQPGQNALLFSASEFKENWLYGIPLCSASGETLSDKVINQRILAIQDYVENALSLKIFAQKIVDENQDFNLEQFVQWGFIQTDWSINHVESLTGNYNQQQVLVYPQEWLSVRGSNDQNAFNNLYIVPNGQNDVALNYLYASWSTIVLQGVKRIPNFWKVTYCTGFDPVPPDLIRLIGLYTSIDILTLIEQVIQGRTLFGLASSSINLDGLSQSTSKMNGGNIFQNRIKDARQEANDIMTKLRVVYGGLKFTVC